MEDSKERIFEVLRATGRFKRVSHHYPNDFAVMAYTLCALFLLYYILYLGLVLLFFLTKYRIRHLMIFL